MAICTIHWIVILLIIYIIVGLIRVFILDDRDSYLGTSEKCVCFLYIIFIVMAVILYGERFWW